MKTLLALLALLGLACTLSTPNGDPGAASAAPTSEPAAMASPAAQEVRAATTSSTPAASDSADATQESGPREVATSAQGYEELRREAESRFAEGSYELARRVYEQAAALELAREDRRWVEFRLADTLWRSAAASNDPDSSRLDAALRELERIVAAAEREEQKDRTWAEAQESFGDLHWRQQSQQWWAAWPHYEAALEHWGGSSDLETARARYLHIVFGAAQPEWHRPYWGHGAYATYMPVGVLENAVAIAKSEEDQDRAHFLLGIFYVNQGQNAAYRGRVERELGAVVERGKKTPWYDDALYHLGTYLENTGRATRNAQGAWTWKADFVGALALYRRILAEFERGETAWYDDAQSRAQTITESTVWVSVDQFFLPGSEITYRLGWRNAGRVELELHATDLVQDLEFAGQSSVGEWLERLPLGKRAAARSLVHDTKDTGDHHPGQAELHLEEKLAPGAYVLLARAGGKSARALVLVSDVALTTKLVGGKALAWLTSVESGAPIAEAKLRLWQGSWENGHRRWREARGSTAVDGTFLFDLGPTQQPEYFLSASLGERQAFVQSNANPSLTPSQEWRLYAFTDRPAYRPRDEVSWKVVARRYDGTRYSTPAGETLEWEVVDPRGATVSKGTQLLGKFGTFSGKLPTDELMPLGEFQVRFFHGKRRDHVGQATLFRLEEYKLPEFEVSVQVPRDERGQPKLFRVGERVTAEIEAAYYFGGPVAEANVEVFVHQRPFAFAFPEEREFPWFYEPEQDAYWGGYGQQIVHQVLRTDRTGKALLVFDTPPDASTDLEFTIEARVTDASRREIVGQESLKVTRQGFFVDVAAKHAIHRPGAKIELELRARDANGNPVAAQGKATVVRQRWVEIWCDATGREVLGDELARLRERPFPPAPGWWCRTRGYEEEIVASAAVAIGADGRGAFEFTPPKDGVYQVTWRGVDAGDVDVVASTTVFVADETTRELGYLSGGIEILLDQDTLEVGGEAAVLLVAPASGRHVLFTVEGMDLYHHEVVRLDGTVKLVRVPISEVHVPNCWLGAVSISAGQAFEDREELVVPPSAQFLDVELAFDREAYEPGTKGALQVRVRDRAGRPVETELAVAVIDEAVAYIQSELAGDPRQFFYGAKRWLAVRTAGTWNHGRFGRLVEKDGKVEDERLGFLGEKEGVDGVQDRLRALGYTGESDARFEKAGIAGQLEMSAMAPAAEAATAMGRRDQGKDANGAYRGAGDTVPPGGGGAEPVVRVRSDFRETALWVADAHTDEKGEARLEVSFPDSTTRWQATVRSCDAGTRVGIGAGSARTRQPLIARLQAPRFFLVGDVVTLSGNLNNNTDAPLKVRATLAADGLEILGRLAAGELVASEAEVEVPANGETRVDWRVRVVAPGEAKLLLKAVGAEHGDAVERTFKIWPHGIEALVATAGKLEGGGAEELAFALELPPRAPGSTRFAIQVTPSLAVTMLDALPYLVDYPYGCTEQTLSRFLPSVIVLKTLRDSGLSPEEAMERVFGGIEGEFAAKTHPKGKQALADLDAMVKAGLERLYDFQHADGGWSWWKDGDSDRFMTAYVLWGLSLAREAGVDVRAGVLEAAARWLATELVELEREPDMQAWCLHALAVYGGESGDPRSREWIANAFANLWQEKDALNAYGRALLALSAKHLGHAEEARVLVDNLVNGAKIDRSPDTSIVQGGAQASRPYVLATAHWGEDGIYRRWSDGGVEATAFCLRALMEIDPGHELVGPTMNWLVKNRRGAQWSNTRDTAIVVLAMNEYLRASGELGAEVAFEVEVNGKPLAQVRLSKDELLRAPSEIQVPEELARDGANRIVIRRTRGAGPLYFAARAHFTSLEEPVAPRGNELFVRREYWKLTGRPTLLEGYVYDRVLLRDGDEVASGERIEVVLSVEAKNHLEYLVFEDLKPAGFEATEVKSGESFVTRELKEAEARLRFAAEDAEDLRAGASRGTHDTRLYEPGYTGRSRGLHQELRDRKVAIFADRLPQGFWEMRYELRAEAPGSFHALPVLAHAMYVPEIRANGAELRVTVVEARRE